jgi:hypothetical protein
MIEDVCMAHENFERAMKGEPVEREQEYTFAVEDKVTIKDSALANRTSQSRINLRGKVGTVKRVNRKSLKVDFDGHEWKVPKSIALPA